MSKLKPVNGNVILRPVEEQEMMSGNIIIPDMGKEKPEMGTVLAVGPGRISANGTLIENKLRKGQTVMVPKFGAQVVELNREKYIMASENDVLGIIKPTEDNE